MRTYLNEIHQQYKDNYQYANYKDKNDINLPQNKLTKNKSGLFLNNFFRTTNTNNKKNDKIYNSFKKSTNINSNKTLKNYKKKKKINVTPYQGIKNEYILNLAMNNLNKYQENLLLKENIGENWSEDKLYMNLNLNNENENSNINNISNQTNNLDFSLKEKNNSINILKRNNPLDKSIMNKTQENFRHKDSYYKNYYISDDLFNYNKRSKDNQKNNAPKPEPYLSSKSIINNDSNTDYNNNSNTNINYEKNYENKFNTFINKEFNIKKDNTKNLANKNKEIYDEKIIFVLTNLELNELIKIFEQNYIYFDDLFLLTKEDFMEMKIPIGPRNRIINFMEKYKNIAKTYDMEELSSFMEKYKQVLINSNDNDNFNFNVTPSTNNKYKSTTTSENNKNKGSFDSHGSDLPGKGLNMSNFNFEDAETLSPRLEEKQNKKNINSKAKNRNRNRNQEYEVNIDNKNKIFNDINQIINETNLNSSENNKIYELQKNGLYNKENNNNNINKKKYNSSRIDDKFYQKQNINNDENSNFNLNLNYNENINSGNIFSNSLFNEYSRNINDINETLNMNNINETNNNNLYNIGSNNKNAYNKNSSFNKENINNIMSTNSSNAKDNKSEFSNNTTNNNNDNDTPSLNLLNNKKNNSYKNNINNMNINQNTYKTFQNIFSEIENYQINYEKMKKEKDNRNNKINNLLEKKNRPNLQYLKMKIKNSKYYNEEDLKNESVRDLKCELEKMNFHKENDNNELNSMKYNPSQNYLKARNNRTNNNPLIEEFNKHK